VLITGFNPTGLNGQKYRQEDKHSYIPPPSSLILTLLVSVITRWFDFLFENK